MVNEGPDQLEKDPAETADLFESTDQVRYHHFNLTRKGYEPDEVLEYLADLAGWIDRLQAAVRRLDGRLREQQQRPEAATPVATSDPYDQLASRLASVLRSAEEYAAGARKVADKEAGTTVAEASERAEDVRRRASVDAEQIRSGADRLASEARSEAERVLSTVWPINSTILETVRDLHVRPVHIAGEIEGHVRALEEIDQSSRAVHESIAGVRAPAVRAASAPAGEIDRDSIDLPDATPAAP